VHFVEALRINPDDASLRAVLRQATDRRDRMRP
jgi:hypothetical protein